MKELTWGPDELAYDGSSRPQERELTPRERDILTRILNDIFFAIRREVEAAPGARLTVTPNDLDCLIFDGRMNGGIRLELDELQLVSDIRGVIDPRGE